MGVLRAIGVLLASFLLFLPLEDLGSPVSVGAMDQGSLQASSRCSAVDEEDICAA